MKRIFLYTLAFLFLATSIMMLGRFLVIFSYVSFDDIVNIVRPFDYIFLAFRLDLQIISYLVISFIVLSVFIFFLPIKVNKFFTIIVKWILFSLLLVVGYFEFINYFFYKQFKTSINHLFLEFFQPGNFEEVIEIILNQYSIITSSIVFISAIFLIYISYNYLTRKIEENTLVTNFYHSSKLFSIIFIICIFSFYSFLGRGNVHKIFPLSISDTEGIVNHNSIIENSMINGFYSLVHSLSVLKINFDYSDIDKQQVLKAYNYLYKKNITNIKELKLEDLFVNTSHNPIFSQKPNIIFTLLESFDSLMYDFSLEQFNLLSTFENHINEDLYFPNFISATNGTLGSLEKILFNAPNYLFSKSKYLKNKNNPLFITTVLRKLGYRTIFIIPGKKYWHNLKEIMGIHFDEIYTYGDIKQAFPNAQERVYGGLADEFMYRFINEKLLSQNNSQPFFIFSLSWSNHESYENCKPESFINIHFNQKQLNEIQQNDKYSFSQSKEWVNNALNCYHYANNSYGNFLSRVKNNPQLKDNTIISATGDHYMRNLFFNSNNSTANFYQYTIPWYLYLPNKYKNQLPLNLKKIGTHLDIFPTIFNLCCKNTEFFPSGNNFFSSAFQDESIQLNEAYTIYQNMGYINNSKNQFFTWKNSQNIVKGVQYIENINTQNEKKLKNYNLYYNTLLKWAMHTAHTDY